MENKPLKFGAIGLGFIYPRHKKAIKELGHELVVACDIDPQKIDKDCAFETDWEKVLRYDIDYVSILTPNDTHMEMIMHALSRGKKVIVEKPPFIGSDELAILKRRGVKEGDVSVVLQLRHHPEVLKLKEKITSGHNVTLTVKVKRDKSYWHGWKGDEKRSGGILYNLGVHYLDLLLLLFGNQYKIKRSSYSDTVAFGQIEFQKATVDYHIEIMDTNEGQTRDLIVDGEQIQLSTQDNLSQEDLHTQYYERALKGHGDSLDSCFNVIRLIENLKNER